MDQRANTSEILISNDHPELKKERMLEAVMKMVKELQTGQDVTPVVIGRINNEAVVIPLEVGEDGNYRIPEIKTTPKIDLQVKSKLVNRIVEKVSPVIKAQIDGVTYMALMRKDMDLLKAMLEGVNSNAPIRIENRVGCIWLIVGETEFVI